MNVNVEILRDVAEMLMNGEGPDFAARMDEQYADWLLELADDIETGKRSI